jgi:hypothetical protein
MPLLFTSVVTSVKVVKGKSILVTLVQVHERRLSCFSVGGHYNPHSARHGSPEKDIKGRHVGDLGNVRANSEGRATFKIPDHLVKVRDIIGRSVVIAEKPDDLGQGTNQLSKVKKQCLDKLNGSFLSFFSF